MFTNLRKETCCYNELSVTRSCIIAQAQELYVKIKIDVIYCNSGTSLRQSDYKYTHKQSHVAFHFGWHINELLHLELLYCIDLCHISQVALSHAP